MKSLVSLGVGGRMSIRQHLIGLEVEVATLADWNYPARPLQSVSVCLEEIQEVVACLCSPKDCMSVLFALVFECCRPCLWLPPRGGTSTGRRNSGSVSCVGVYTSMASGKGPEAHVSPVLPFVSVFANFGPLFF